MALEIRPYREEDLAGMLKVWNEVVEGGEAFPQIEPLTLEKAAEFFAAQTLSVVADLDGKVMGLYVLHPNNVGRCAHVGNASYAVASSVRGLGLGPVSYTHLDVYKRQGRGRGAGQDGGGGALARYQDAHRVHPRLLRGAGACLLYTSRCV